MKNTVLVYLLLAAAAVLAGCSGSDGVVGSGSGNERAPNSADVTGVMQQVVLPTIDGDFTPSEAAIAPAPPDEPSPAPAGDPCSTIGGFCSSGSHEICHAAGNVWTFGYDACARPVGVIEGNWTLDLEGLGVSGAATFALSIDELTLAGGVDYSREGLCWERTYANLSATSPHWATVVDGSVRFCLAGGGREGDIEVSIVGDDTVFHMSLQFEGGTGEAVIVHDDRTLTCTVNMTAGTAECVES